MALPVNGEHMDKSSASFWIVATIAGLLAGCAMAIQPAVNGRLSASLSHPLQASLVSFGVGFLALVIVGFLMRSGIPSTSDVQGLPWWAWTGGLLGTFMVTASLLVAPSIGATRWIALVLAGQISLSLVLDHFGLLGYSQTSLSARRLFGVALVTLGVFLVMQRK